MVRSQCSTHQKLNFISNCSIVHHTNLKVSKYNVLVKKVDAWITFSKDKMSKEASYFLVSKGLDQSNVKFETPTIILQPIKRPFFKLSFTEIVNKYSQSKNSK